MPRVILCRRFKDGVMCVHEVQGRQARCRPRATKRGRRDGPMFLGATSKVILANLPDRTLKSVYLANEKTHSAASLKVGDWKGRSRTSFARSAAPAMP